jgi:predicted ribosomally synthesized peptide with SipW-like signal peptide
MGCKIMKSVMKKTIAVGTLCTMLMGTAAYGTLAYFKEEETATNTFTSGNFKMDLTETHWEWYENAQEDGKQIEDWNKPTKAQALDYKRAVDSGSKRWGKDAANKFVPGRIIHKNPAVTIEKGNIPVYVRMTLQVPTTVYSASNLTSTSKEVVNFDINKRWRKIESKEDGKNTILVYEYVGENSEGAQVINPEETNQYLAPLFTRIQINEEGITSDDLVNLLPQTEGAFNKNQTFDIVVNAYGVQADEFANANEAFGATYPEVFNKE